MQKIVSISLAFLLLLSSSSLAYGQHFCGGRMVADALVIGQKALSCFSTDDAKEDALETSHKIEKPNCCVDIYHQITTDDDYAGGTQFAIDKVFVAAYIHTFLLQISVDDEAEQKIHLAYLPPPIDKDIPVLYQSFLI